MRKLVWQLSIPWKEKIINDDLRDEIHLAFLHSSLRQLKIQN